MFTTQALVNYTFYEGECWLCTDLTADIDGWLKCKRMEQFDPWANKCCISVSHFAKFYSLSGLFFFFLLPVCFLCVELCEWK